MNWKKDLILMQLTENESRKKQSEIENTSNHPPVTIVKWSKKSPKDIELQTLALVPSIFFNCAFLLSKMARNMWGWRKTRPRATIANFIYNKTAKIESIKKPVIKKSCYLNNYCSHSRPEWEFRYTHELNWRIKSAFSDADHLTRGFVYFIVIVYYVRYF